MLLKIMLLTIVFFSFNFVSYAQITLTHNIGTTPIETGMPSCDYDEYWARTFTLSDFGITTTDQFIIKSGQIAISNSYEGAKLVFNIYSIDSNFPNTTLNTLSYGNLVLAPAIGDSPEIVQIDFSTPIVVPAGVERILVEVTQYDDIYNSDYKKVLIAGTAQDNDISWFQGCRELYTYTPTESLNLPVPNANFFINVTGELLDTQSSGSTTRLSHNVCYDIIETNIYSCKSSYIYWARTFDLEDFGVSTNEEFTINSGQVGINKTGYLPEISFNIYKIDSNFPASFSEADLIGSSQYQRLNPNINRNSQIIQVDFDAPVVIPAGVERILVEVHKGIIYGDGVAFIAGSAKDNSESWQRGCVNGSPPDEYVSTADFGYPDANFYINVTGKSNNVAIPYNMNITNICSEFLKEFSLTNVVDIATVVWNFGDTASGASNVSNDLSPTHDFSVDGEYTVTATVTDNSSNVYVIEEKIDVVEPPNAYAISNIYACEDVFGTGISTTFSTANIESQVLGGQTDKVITYFDGSGKELTNPLPTHLTNLIKDRETITVRVAHDAILCCYSETSFDLIVQPLPEANTIDNTYLCNSGNNGFASFDLTALNDEILGSQTNVSVIYYNQSGSLIPNSELSNYSNAIINKEIITARVTNTITNCYNETKFDIGVNSPPVANTLSDLVGCDDNKDGVSEYFDTSDIEATVLGNQTGMEVSYFDSGGNLLPSPLPNPYTNSSPNQEIIIVRVTNSESKCYTETNLSLKTSEQPQINQLANLFACDEGNGFAHFDTSTLEFNIIGNQQGLKISYSNESGNALPSPLPRNYKNTVVKNQLINVKVENELNNRCYSETSFRLIVNELPEIDLEKDYFLCDLEPSLPISIDSNFDVYKWTYEDGTVISTSEDVDLIKEGSYTISVSRLENGILCQNSFSFNFVRSTLPKIETINYGGFGDNYIEVMVSGDGDFEYSLDNITYQTDNRFSDLLGGNYTVYVQDVKGCGFLTEKITIIDAPKFFSPNNDGINDTWQLDGDINQNYTLHIFNRFGKLLKQLNNTNYYWDGFYNGKLQPPDDYWFKLVFSDGTVKSGNFALLK
ncbi:T9SS type B sorting domain-containing protein [Aureibaculum luteum]|uniref:T9SS type B sorting domain-containing protein n=1 Tax=Aureibaculum luteum TaxID=1548456 RepID=UPI001E3AF923|nr:T9SS type B sorting domain-containing protein [Aureibaculum luteum]